MIKRLMKEYQSELLNLANSEAGRYLLGIKNRNRIIKLTSNSYHQLMDFCKDNAIIYSKHSTDSNEIARILLPVLTKMQIANDLSYSSFLHYSGLETRNHKYSQIYLTSANYNVGTGSGQVRAGNGDLSWAGQRGDTTGGTVEVNQAQSEAPVAALVAPNYFVYRAFFPTNTASLTTSVTVLSAVFNGYVNSVGGSGTFHIVQTSQASTDTLASADIDNVTFTSGGSVAISGTGAYTVTLNATGMGYISKNGVTKIGSIEDNDLTNTTPVAKHSITQNFSGALSNKPYLTIVYSYGGSFLFLL